jgi:hypothetical protein
MIDIFIFYFYYYYYYYYFDRHWLLLQLPYIGQVNTAAIGADGTIYITSADKHLYALGGSYPTCMPRQGILPSLTSTQVYLYICICINMWICTQLFKYQDKHIHMYLYEIYMARTPHVCPGKAYYPHSHPHRCVCVYLIICVYVNKFIYKGKHVHMYLYEISVPAGDTTLTHIDTGVYLYVCMYKVYTCFCMYIKSMYKYMYISIYIYIYPTCVPRQGILPSLTSTQVCVYMYVYMFICIYVHMFIYIYVNIYI